MSEHRSAHADKQREEINEIEARLGLLLATARELKATAKIESYELLDEFTPKHDEARHKLEALRHASEATWADLKEGVERATEELQKAVDSAARRFGS